MRATTLKILLLLAVLTARTASAHPRHASTRAVTLHRGASRAQPARTLRGNVRRTIRRVTPHSRPARVAIPVRAQSSPHRKRHVALAPRIAIRPIKWRPQAPEQPDLLLPILTFRRGRVILPAALKGSHEVLVHQNQMADQDGLRRLQDDDDLIDARNRGTLVPLPTGYAIRTDERLPWNRRYTRPWAAVFLEALARAHYAAFHTPIQVNSAVRTVAFQQHLLHTNGNAAPTEGEAASPHLTGQAIDLAKHGLSLTEIAWLRAYLLPLSQQGKIDVEEEFHQACFHISVYRRYLPLPLERRVTIPVRSTAAAIAAAVPSVAPAP